MPLLNRSRHRKFFFGGLICKIYIKFQKNWRKFLKFFWGVICKIYQHFWKTVRSFKKKKKIGDLVGAAAPTTHYPDLPLLFHDVQIFNETRNLKIIPIDQEESFVCTRIYMSIMHMYKFDVILFICTLHRWKITNMYKWSCFQPQIYLHKKFHFGYKTHFHMPCLANKRTILTYSQGALKTTKQF